MRFADKTHSGVLTVAEPASISDVRQGIMMRDSLIANALDRGVSPAVLGKMFGLHPGSVYRIASRVPGDAKEAAVRSFASFMVGGAREEF